MCFRKEDHRGNVIYHIISRLHSINVTITVDVDLGHLAEAVFVRFLYGKATLLFSLSVLSSLGGCASLSSKELPAS